MTGEEDSRPNRRGREELEHTRCEETPTPGGRLCTAEQAGLFVQCALVRRHGFVVGWRLWDLGGAATAGSCLGHRAGGAKRVQNGPEIGRPR